MLKWILILKLTLVTILIPTATAEYRISGTDFTIKRIENGWFGEGMALTLDKPLANDECPAPDNEAAISANHASKDLLYSLAITAQSTKQKVRLVYDSGNCTFGARVTLLSIMLLDE